MDLYIQKLTKAFNKHIVFSDLTFTVSSGQRLAITGSNGSGKSTLLKILSGATLASTGDIRYTLNERIIPEDQIYKYVHFVAPYNTVIEELTLKELFELHQRLGLLTSFRNFNDWFLKLNYTFVAEQQIKLYSSGMKQRVKLALALLDNRPLILLDEPGSNLDGQGKEWLSTMLGQVHKDQTLIIASNDHVEISYCEVQINLGTRS